MTEKIAQALQAIELLAELPPAFVAQLAQFSMLRKIRAGETIFCQGEPSPYCFGIVSGQVTIQRVPRSKEFPAKTLSILGPGALFGEQALFKDTPRTAMALASQDGELIAIQGKPFRDWLEKDKEVATPLLLGMFQNTLTRLRQTSHELSLVYGVGRYLASDKPIQDRISETAGFLRASLENVDQVVVYQRSPYWDEFDPIVVASEGTSVPEVLPHTHPLVQRLSQTSRPVIARQAAETQGNAALVLIPFIDNDDTRNPFQGFLWVASKKDPSAFSSNIVLLLTGVSVQFTEALLRQRRQEDQDAQSRLRQSRQSFRL